MKKMNLPKNLVYVESPRFKGIFLRVMWNGKMVRRGFSFSRYGGLDGAIKAAVGARYAIETEFKKPHTERKITSLIFKRGITEVWKPCTRDGKKLTHHYYICACPKPNKVFRTTVSINKWGPDVALARAKQIREKMTASYYEKEKLNGSITTR